MKSIVSILFLLFGLDLVGFAQPKLIANSQYHHDSTGFFLNDSSQHFYKAANATNAIQMYDDATVTKSSDSTLAYGNNAGALYLSSKEVNTYNANYSQRTQYLGYLYNNLGTNT